MKTFVITYDLNKEGQAYKDARDKIVKAIESIGEAKRILTTTWLVKTNYSSTQVGEVIKRSIDDNDRYLTCQLCRELTGWLSGDDVKFISSAPKCC